MSEHTEYVSELVGQVAPEVWHRAAGNGGLRIHIDTDVDCYGEWEPHKVAPPGFFDSVADAQGWFEYVVRSTINRLIDRDLLKIPGTGE